MVRKRVAWVNIEIGVPYPSTPPHYPSLVNHSLCACVFVSFTNILQATRVPTALFSSALQCLQHHEQHPQHYSVRNTTNKQLQWPAWRQPVIYKSWSLLQTTTVNQTIAIHITGQQTNQPNKQTTNNCNLPPWHRQQSKVDNMKMRHFCMGAVEEHCFDIRGVRRSHWDLDQQHFSQIMFWVSRFCSDGPAPKA